jgi:hypothetical protein
MSGVAMSTPPPTRTRVLLGLLSVFALADIVNVGVDASVSAWVWALAACGFATGLAVFLGSLYLRVRTSHRGLAAQLMTAESSRHTGLATGIAVFSVPFVHSFVPASGQVVLLSTLLGALVAFCIVPPRTAATLARRRDAEDTIAEREQLAA